MKKAQITLLVVLALATAATIGCSGASSSSNKSTLPTYTEVAFISNQPESPATDLFLMNLDGTNVTPVPFSSTDVWQPSASANLNAIAFNSEGNIWASNASGSTQTQLTNVNTSDFYIYSVRVSPDGTKIVYGEGNDSTEIGDLWVMNADGTNPLNLTSSMTSSGIACYNGSFSADGSQIVFMCDNEGSSNISLYTVNADGSGLTTVFSQSSYCTGQICDTPAFSPDGTQILFVSYSVPQSGARPHQPAASRPSIPGFRRRPSPKDPSTGPGIVSIGVDGSNPTVINQGAFELEVLNSTLFYSAYDSNSAEDQVFSANLDGTNPVMLTTSSSFYSELGVTVFE